MREACMDMGWMGRIALGRIDADVIIAKGMENHFAAPLLY